jgi:hypothetical protein
MWESAEVLFGPENDLSKDKISRYQDNVLCSLPLFVQDPPPPSKNFLLITNIGRYYKYRYHRQHNFTNIKISIFTGRAGGAILLKQFLLDIPTADIIGLI